MRNMRKMNKSFSQRWEEKKSRRFIKKANNIERKFCSMLQLCETRKSDSGNGREIFSFARWERANESSQSEEVFPTRDFTSQCENFPFSSSSVDVRLLIRKVTLSCSLVFLVRDSKSVYCVSKQFSPVSIICEKDLFTSRVYRVWWVNFLEHRGFSLKDFLLVASDELIPTGGDIELSL